MKNNIIIKKNFQLNNYFNSCPSIFLINNCNNTIEKFNNNFLNLYLDSFFDFSIDMFTEHNYRTNLKTKESSNDNDKENNENNLSFFEETF